MMGLARTAAEKREAANVHFIVFSGGGSRERWELLRVAFGEDCVDADAEWPDSKVGYQLLRELFMVFRLDHAFGVSRRPG